VLAPPPPDPVVLPPAPVGVSVGWKPLLGSEEQPQSEARHRKPAAPATTARIEVSCLLCILVKSAKVDTASRP
jgi:hypothetical protein